MGTRRTPLRIAVVCAFAAIAAAASCRDPTEVTLVLTTDVDCATLNETSITVGTSDDVTMKSPVAVTSMCTPTGAGDSTIGTFVVIPDSTGASDAFAVRVISAVGKPATADCTASDNYTGCIVALRDLSFVSHTPLTLPIVMRLDCVGVVCPNNQTCVEGVCKSADIDPHRCETNCGEGTLPPADAGDDGGDEASSGGHHDSSTPDDVTTAEEPPPEATMTMSGPDATEEAEAEAMEVGPVDSPVDAPADVPVDVGVDAPVDASVDVGVDARADASVDAPADVGVDAPFEGSSPGDGSVTGPCVTAGSSAGVACAGGVCTGGEVCCIEVSGTTVTEMCTSAGACNTNSTSPVFSSFSCRNIGDCPSGKVCCTVGDTVGNSFTNTCMTSCGPAVTKKIACQNTCECSTGMCDEVTCGGIPMGTCGGFCP